MLDTLATKAKSKKNYAHWSCPKEGCPISTKNKYKKNAQGLNFDKAHEAICPFKPESVKVHDEETEEIQERIKVGRNEKKERAKKRRRFHCPYSCIVTGANCTVKYSTYKYAGALEHLRICPHKDLTVMRTYILEKGLIKP